MRGGRSSCGGGCNNLLVVSLLQKGRQGMYGNSKRILKTPETLDTFFVTFNFGVSFFHCISLCHRNLDAECFPVLIYFFFHFFFQKADGPADKAVPSCSSQV